MADKILNVHEVARLLKVSDATVRIMVREGKFPNAYQMTPGKETSPFCIPEKDVTAFEKSRQRPFARAPKKKV